MHLGGQGIYEPKVNKVPNSPTGSASRSVKGGVTVGQHVFRVHVIPGSKQFGVVGWDHWRNTLVIKLKNPAEGGKANRELVEVLSSLLGCPVEIIRGATNRDKVISAECDDSKFREISQKIGLHEEV